MPSRQRFSTLSRLILQGAHEGMVLLKNDGLLPKAKDSKAGVGWSWLEMSLGHRKGGAHGFAVLLVASM